MLSLIFIKLNLQNNEFKQQFIRTTSLVQHF